MYNFATKAETLDFLYHVQNRFNFKILPLKYYQIKDWKSNPEKIWKDIRTWGGGQ